MSDDDYEGVQTKWLSRRWQQAKSAASAGKMVLSRGENAAAAAEALRIQLDSMKGMAMKLGQIVSYMDVPLPDELKSTLESLQTGTMALPWEKIRPLIEERLGQPVEALFIAVDEKAVAAASIGQVHRAAIANSAFAEVPDEQARKKAVAEQAQKADAEVSDEQAQKKAVAEQAQKKAVAEQAQKQVVEEQAQKAVAEQAQKAVAEQAQKAVAEQAQKQVAVKVLYPGIADSFSTDTKGLEKIAALASMASSVNGNAIVEELGRRLQEECDYEREARSQQAFYRVWREDDQIVIPHVISELSAQGILTTEWIDGLTFSELLTSEPKEKNAAAMTMLRFGYTSLLVHAAIQADLHPGNQVFLKNGRVAFLDFGCVRTFEVSFIQTIREWMEAIMEDRRAEFEARSIKLGFIPNVKRFDFDHHWKTERTMFAPFLSSHYQYDGTYMKTLMEMNGPKNPNARTQAMGPEWVWIYRLVYGLHATLSRLRASGNFQGLLLSILDQEISPTVLDAA